MSTGSSRAAVLQLFAVLFSARWIRQWQRRQERTGPAGGGAKKNCADSMNAFSPCRSRYGI